jgi:hypothetical protein
VPVVGLLAFDTSAAALLVFYWLELGVLMIWATVRALFAGKLPGEETEREPFSGPQWATPRVVLPSRFFDDGDEVSAADDGLEESADPGSGNRCWGIPRNRPCARRRGAVLGRLSWGAPDCAGARQTRDDRRLISTREVGSHGYDLAGWNYLSAGEANVS